MSEKRKAGKAGRPLSGCVELVEEHGLEGEAHAEPWHRPVSFPDSEITHLGKERHGKCDINYQVGDCIMSLERGFARVLKGEAVSIY